MLVSTVNHQEAFRGTTFAFKAELFHLGNSFAEQGVEELHASSYRSYMLVCTVNHLKAVTGTIRLSLPRFTSCSLCSGIAAML